MRTPRPPSHFHRGRNSAPGYHCCGKDLVNGGGVYCLNVGGMVIEQGVADAFLKAITPAAIEATRLSIEQLQANHDAAFSVPPKYEGPGRNHVMLPAGNRRNIVVGSARVVVAGLASKSEETPNMNVYTCAEIEDSATKLPGG